MTVLKIAAAIGLLACTSAINAADNVGIFFGGNVGYANLSEDQRVVAPLLNQPGFAGSVNIDDNDLGWKAFFGYSFSQYFGVEGGYVDVGEAVLDLNATAPVALTNRSSASISGYTATAVFRWPLIDDLELLGKFGGFFWDADIDSATTTAGTTVFTNLDDDGTDMTAGIGLKYQFSEHVGVRAEWDRYINVGDGGNEIDLFSMGIEFTY